jgi:hypothetical protein
MLRLAKAFWDLALWRMSPAQLPASVFLLVLVALLVALLEVLGVLLPPYSTDRIPVRVVLSVGLPIAWAWAVLSLTRRQARFLQTAIALLGLSAIAQLVLYPLASMLNVLGLNQPISIVVGLASFVGLIWYVVACAYVWRAALDSGLGMGVAVSVGYLVVSMLLDQYLLPDA